MTNPYDPPREAADPGEVVDPGREEAVEPQRLDPAAEKAVQDAAGVAVMCSVGALFCFGPLAFLAISKGNAIRKTIDATGVGRAYRSNATGAVVVGYVALVVWTLGFFARFLE